MLTIAFQIFLAIQVTDLQMIVNGSVMLVRDLRKMEIYVNAVLISILSEENVLLIVRELIVQIQLRLMMKV